MSSSSSINKCYYNYELPINSFNSNLKNSIHYAEPLKYDKCSYEIITETNSNNTNIKNYQISNSSISIKNDKSIFTQFKSIAKEKLIYKYNCTKRKYNTYIVNNILRNDYCCIVSKFKDNILINNFNKEYFYKYYKTPEIKITMVKFYPFYKTYFNFYCKPILNDISLAASMKHYFDTKAKCFLNLEYHNENTNFDDKNNLSKKNSESSEELINESKTNNNDNIFNSKVKDVLDNVTIMTTIPNDSETGSINLDIDRERIEIYRENKKEYSNDTTFAEIMDFIEIKKNSKNNFLKFNKLRNKVKNELLKNKNNIIKNCLNYNKNNLELRNNFMNVLKKHNKKKIPINKINILLQKIKMNNLGKKINRNLLQENNDKSIDNKNKKNDANKSINSNINTNSNSNKAYSNLGNIIVKSSNLNIDERPNIAKKINTKKINEDIRKYYKNINNIINDYQNKENINNNFITNTNNSKNIKKVNKSISNIKSNKDNKIINQKISFKNRKKQSRNKNSFYQSIQSLSSINQNPERSQNIKNKKISLHKTFVKNQSNNKTIINNNDTVKSFIPPTKTNHLRHKTKFIKYQNVEKIFQNIYSKIKKTYINNNHQIQNNDHNNNQSTLFKTIIIENSSLNNINHNLINSPANVAIDNSISNTFLKKSIYHSIYNNGSTNLLQKKENSKMNFKIKKIKNDNKRYSINQNSLNNKSYSLNKTSDKNYFLNNYLNVANSLKKSYKSLSKKKKYIYNNKINTINKKRIKNIKSFNNNSLNNRGKGPINIDESKYKNIQKINSFSNKRKHKNSKFKEIYINIKKEIKSSKYDLIKIAKKCYNEKTITQNHNLNSIQHFIKKEKKIKLRNDDLRNKTGKTTMNNLKYIDNSKYSSNKENLTYIINSFHNKSQSTYGLDLNSRKFMKFYM